MNRAIHKVIVAGVLLLSFSASHVSAQFWKKKSTTASSNDTTAVMKDSTVSAKDSIAAEKEKSAAAAKKVKMMQDTMPAKQDTAFWPGQNFISFGYGIFAIDPDIIRWVYQIDGATASIFGPIYLKFEHAIDYHWTLGLNFAYGHYNITSPNNYGKDVYAPTNYQEFRSDNTISLLARVNYHFEMIKHWDPYIGFALGYRNSSSTYRTNDPSGEAPSDWDDKFPGGFEATAGARYVMSKNTSFYAEFGLAKSLLQIGLSFKLK